MILSDVWNTLRRRADRISFLGARGSLRHLMVRGTAWVIVGYGSSQLIRFGSNLILTRLLFPELFGLMALVNTFLLGLALLSDVGLWQSIVQNRRGGEPAFVNTVWTIQAVRGIGLWGVSLLLAAPFAEFYGEPRLAVLIPIAAVSILIGGFNSTSLFMLQRELQVGRFTRIELIVQLCGVVVLLIWAWRAPTVWALVAGGIASAVARLVISHWVHTGERNHFMWDAETAHAIWGFGKWIFLSSAVAFFAEQSDRLMLGKVVPLGTLGVYGIALTFAEIPRQISQALSANILFPAFSSLRDVPRPQLREKISRHRAGILYVMALGLTLFVCFGDLLVHGLYDARYEQAAWMLPLLALGLFPRLLCNTIEPALFAIAKPQYTTIALLGRVVWTVAGILLGFALAGIFGAILAIALNDLIYYFVINVGLWREGLSELRQDLAATGVLLVLIACGLGLRLVLGLGLPAYV